jgi:hypothetical protein
MHRSGTSLIARLLADTGIHMGSWLSRDAEAVHFQRLNRRIYKAAGSTWASVDGIVGKMRSPAFVGKQAEATERRLFRERVPGLGSPLARFFGGCLWGQVRRGQADGQGVPAWGWKDPRTTLTLPVWVRIFPGGRYLFVLRNGIDVAMSMHRRSRNQQGKLRNRLFPVDYSPATLDLVYCFRLWEIYVSAALEHRALIPATQHLEVRYEKLLAQPETQLRRIVEFSGHQVSDEQLAEACKRIEQGRREHADHAACYDEQIEALALLSRPLMQQLGYGSSLPAHRQSRVKSLGVQSA